FDIDGDGDEAAGGGLGEVSGPLVYADGADDLLGLRNLVHLGRGNRSGEGCGADDCAEKESSHGLLTRLDAICGAKSYSRALNAPCSAGIGVGRFRLVFEAWVRCRCWM